MAKEKNIDYPQKIVSKELKMAMIGEEETWVLMVGKRIAMVREQGLNGRWKIPTAYQRHLDAKFADYLIQDCRRL